MTQQQKLRMEVNNRLLEAAQKIKDELQAEIEKSEDAKKLTVSFDDDFNDAFADTITDWASGGSMPTF